ncbi:MAG: C4-dicarboxylate ABC transporter substrate-binding protein [Deltaproteobacteria bacterium RBG_13_47_9]|nr:MAG: C4-dicarboxylate ABC transporter substrate-binding protein [Deltaproteobacteria bacterium RBG_13_47_9]
MKDKRRLKRFSVLSMGLMMALFLGNILVPLPAQAQIKLSYANFPPAPTFPCVQMERWKTEVEKKTAGKVKIETYPGGTLLGAKNMFDGVAAGTADIGSTATSYFPGMFPIVEFVDLPLGWPSATVSSAALWELVEKYKPKELEKFKVLTMFTCPPANIMSMKPILSLEDLKGYELRASGTGAKILGLLGAAAVGMPQSDVPEALQKGVIKGNVSSLEVMKDFKYAEYCRNVTGNVNLFVVSFAVVMNQKKWDALPADVKKVMDDLRKDQAIWTGQYVDNHVKEAMKWSEKTHNVQVYQLSPKEISRWDALLKPMIEKHTKDVEAKGLPAKAVFDDVIKLKGKYSKEFPG